MLLNRFPVEVKATIGGALPSTCLKGLEEIDNVRPLLMIPSWIDGLLDRTCPNKAMALQIKKVWDNLVDNFLRDPWVRKHDSPWHWLDRVDRLEWALKFTKGLGLNCLGRLARRIKAMRFGNDDEFFRNSFSEPAFYNRSSRFIVYGHTHAYEIVPLDRSVQSGNQMEQLYFNTGTWRRVYELAEYHLSEQKFVGHNVMTYATFYQGNERTGRPFETWSASLGCD